MTKIAVGSDIHLEFGEFKPQNIQDNKLLILAGDIILAKNLTKTLGTRQNKIYHQFFQYVSDCFDDVVYVMGNHESYHFDIAKVVGHVRDGLSNYKNIHILDNEVWDWGEYQIFGGTLWTDMNKRDPVSMYEIQFMMNDFTLIQDTRKPEAAWFDMNGRKMRGNDQLAKFLPEDAANEFDVSMSKLTEALKNDKPTIVVTHHLPSYQSIHEKWKGSKMNPGYASELSEFIEQNPNIKTWIHGHTHESCSYSIGNTQVVCHPRGYQGHEASAFNYDLTYIEI